MITGHPAFRILAGGTALGIALAAGSLGYDAGMHQQASTVDPGPMFSNAVDVDLINGDCWNAYGKPKGYPTAMWILDGDTYVRVSDQSAVDAAVASPPANLAAFCDGINLA